MSKVNITTTNAEGDRHTADIQCIIYHEGKIFSGAEDGKIKIWQPSDLKLLGEIKAYENCVYCLAAIGKTLYSASNDGAIKAWDIGSLKLKGTIHQGDTDIYRLYVDSGRLYSGDEKGTVGVFENEKRINTLNVVEEVKDILVRGNILFTVRNLDVIVTEILAGNEGKFAIHTTVDGRAPMAFAGDRICVCAREGKNMTVFTIKDNAKLQKFCTITGSEMILNAISGAKIGDLQVIYSGGWDNIVKRWIVSGEKPLPGGCVIVKSVVNCIAIGPKGEAYVGGFEGIISKLEVS